MIKNIKEKFKKCFELASQGETLAFPNPNVACLIYFQEKLISTGVHRHYGKAHAEVIAINSAKEYFSLNFRDSFESFDHFAAECEIILNLEPCCHYGNTPPCTTLIIESGFKKIAYAAYDINPKVYKKSLEILASKSIEVTKPDDLAKEIQDQAQFINRIFFSIKQKESAKKPPVYVTLKIASYANGSMITKAGDKWITGDAARKEVHRLRSCSQLLISSSATVRDDDPSFSVRHPAKELDLLDSRDPDICIIYHANKAELKSLESERKVFYEKLESLDKKSLEALILKLNFLGYQKIMIEAGPKLSKAFLESGLVDELVVYQPKNARTKEEFANDVENIFSDSHIKKQISIFGDNYQLISY